MQNASMKSRFREILRDETARRAAQADDPVRPDPNGGKI